MHYVRRTGVLVATALALAAGARARAAEPTYAELVKSHEDDIAKYTAVSPDFPPAMIARLSYADFLARHFDTDCAARMAAAEEQRAIVARNPAFEVVYPQASAEMRQIEFAIAYGLAQCTNGDDELVAALEKALVAAQDAVVAYSKLHDYRQMVIAQFNVAKVHHDLNDGEGPRWLELALATDAQYGLRDDALDNFKTLEQWRGHQPDPAVVDRYMKDFPARSVALQFGWRPVTSEIRTEQTLTKMQGGKPVVVAATLTGNGKITKDGTDFVLTVGDVRSEKTGSSFGDELASAIARIAAQTPPMTVGPRGEFKGVADLEGFAGRSGAELLAMIDRLVPADDPRRPQAKAAAESMLKTSLNKDVLDATFRLGHMIETSFWIGATLKQGVISNTKTLWHMPGTPQGFIDSTIEFEVAGFVPCAMTEVDPRCAEILIDIMPTDAAVAARQAELAKQGKGALNYWATTHLRVILDPQTLFCYAREMHASAYVSLKTAAGESTEISSNDTKSTTTYQ